MLSNEQGPFDFIEGFFVLRSVLYIGAYCVSYGKPF